MNQSKPKESPMPPFTDPAHAHVERGNLFEKRCRPYDGKANDFRPAIPAHVQEIGGRLEIVRHVSRPESRREEGT